MHYTLEVTCSERIYREDDGTFIEDIQHPTQKKKFKSVAGWKRVYDYWRNNQAQPIDMAVKDDSGKIIKQFSRNCDGNVIIDL